MLRRAFPYKIACRSSRSVHALIFSIIKVRILSLIMRELLCIEQSIDALIIHLKFGPKDLRLELNILCNRQYLLPDFLGRIQLLKSSIT